MSTVTPSDNDSKHSDSERNGASRRGPDRNGSSVRSPKRRRLGVPHAAKLYHNLVPAYQAVWPAVAGKNIRTAIGRMQMMSGSKVLEVGVGTGLSLPNYPRHVELTGIDLSESMLAEAEALIHRNGWDHIGVRAMNAENLDFEDNQFDVVTSFHTVSVVSNPARMMREIVRVCRPGGQILIINHFRSENPLIAKVVDSAGNVTRRLGWRTDLELQEIMKELPIQIEERYKPNPFSFFTIMRATCKPAA
ncbi:class I SAM-dependent methyltransferase [Roseiconus lacunae]|uniref:Class I SAM-dependent methyltransferase n=1 Tax=Roseiconus lacunae TaxID=2605694 RepID=A0ABT7PLI3_9BACT|nr:class I SAM-dependent methyltransferase [Roseiconus lacunae]MCD0460788.1 class I SAM-dependent methyltransferase [Roseiconus lacunae]MDM4017141.1 class I SAM-dependent methyltransferase [Roseiconus lacunae]WRQ51279.1 class I SAM-dependent methyltransferase [Stieleria sp. HD01]